MPERRIIDAHTHPMLGGGDQIAEKPHPPEAYRELVAGSGVVRAAALTIAPAGDLPRTRAGNDAVLELAGASHCFFYPVCSVHPADGPAALAELDRVASAGCAWLKLDADQPGKFVKLAMAVPESRLILAHAHGPSFPQLLVYEVLARYPWWPRQVWIDISATASLLARGPFAEQFTWVLRRVGVDRIVFGSDYPLDDPCRAIEAVNGLGFSDGELAAIMHDNAAALLG